LKKPKGQSAIGQCLCGGFLEITAKIVTQPVAATQDDTVVTPGMMPWCKCFQLSAISLWSVTFMNGESAALKAMQNIFAKKEDVTN
jgi:hypothetical protein